MQNHHRDLSFFRMILVTLALIILICSSQFAAGQDLKAQIDSLKTVVKGNKSLVQNKDKAISAFLDYLDKLIEIKSYVGAFTASLSASGSFDSGRYSAGAVDVKTNIVRDLYPHALRLDAQSKFMFSPGSEVQNELSSITINYDHYLSKKVEAYGFIQRFTDTYMSIKQRYEAGLGFKFEFDRKSRRKALNSDAGPDRPASRRPRHMSGILSSETPADIQTKTQERTATLVEYVKLRNDFIRHIQKSAMSQEERQKIYQALRIIDRENKDTQIALIKKESPFTWGIALSFLSEVEQAEINTGTVNPETQKNILFPFDPIQFFRLSVRPSFRWQLSDEVSLMSQLYYKPSLRKVGFFKDSRSDIISKMNFVVAKDFLWGGPASISIEHQFHYDRLPPMIPNEQTDSYASRGIDLKFVSGAKVHHDYDVSFSISF